jgi:hypothetical protein
MALINGTNRPDTIDLDNVSRGVVGGPATTGSDTVYAGSGDDKIFTGAGDDTIFGGKGKDKIYAGSGDDIIDGGLGNDTVETGDGSDTLVLVGDGSRDTITDFDAGSGSGPDVTLDFEGLVPEGWSNQPHLGNYGGLNWSNMGVYDDAYVSYPGSGFHNVGSGDFLLTNFNPGSQFTAAGADDFTLESASMAAGWFDGLETTVKGYDDGVEVASQTFALNTAATLVTFDEAFESIDTVTFEGIGGTQVIFPPGGGNRTIAIDDLTLAFETTEPQDVIQVASEEVAAGLLASARDVKGGVALDYEGYHTVLLGHQASNVTADYFGVA